MDAFSLSRLLGGMSPAIFLAEYWQKQPLLVRQALPGFGGWLGRDGLTRLACREDAESRVVQYKRGAWHLHHGPFAAEELENLPAKGWSLLVSGVNHLMPEGDALLNAFDFVPRARLDDLMVSFAPKGGGVGPHFDSYDVFLIQGLGRRRWEISDQTDLSLVPGAPLRILRQFEPTRSWELEPGDMLYLPPRFAHNGIALGECMTWSVGFRSPTAQEVVSQFLNHLQDHLDVAGIYADPGLKPTRHPGEIPTRLLDWTEATINRTRWNKRSIKEFLGRYLSEPKAHVFFDPPARPLTLNAFKQTIARKGLRLDPRTQLLFRGRSFFINGEQLLAAAGIANTLRQLADHRHLPPINIQEELVEIVYVWYRAGYLIV
ncbi:MAG: cupin domain-containing protein [Thiobacillus sp.]|nr:cupin domain-containing protein [Thiobacillus sp.]